MIDLTQQTSGNFEFGQDSQQSYQPWKPQGADQQLGDFTQKTGNLMILLNRLLENLSLVRIRNNLINLGNHRAADQQLGDFTQKTDTGNLMILLNRLLENLSLVRIRNNLINLETTGYRINN